MLTLVGVGRVGLVDRPPIHPYFPAVSEVLLLCLAAAVVGRTQGLQFTKPEQPLVTMMRGHMVRDRRRHHQSLVQTHRTQRMRAQLRLGTLLPATKSIPAIVERFFAQRFLRFDLSQKENDQHNGHDDERDHQPVVVDKFRHDR